ncbi:hypothetical protein [Puniceibacterium sp. IMCC21224]|uniref:hypothetical protein n=1 Tax=Puniceibacterium sp. IMCC21224 TaxID=1618204 RepID=UPI0012DFFA73|nr:hypothetical protein [Puniceibacterium sp. IMCC21224]
MLGHDRSLATARSALIPPAGMVSPLRQFVRIVDQDLWGMEHLQQAPALTERG